MPSPPRGHKMAKTQNIKNPLLNSIEGIIYRVLHKKSPVFDNLFRTLNELQKLYIFKIRLVDGLKLSHLEKFW